MKQDLQGVQISRGLAHPGLRQLMSKSLARRSLVSYEVVVERSSSEKTVAASAPAEKRASARRRVRLRSGKLLDARNTFISECLVRDESAEGLCLLLARNVGLPARCRLYDDETETIKVVTTVWRRELLVGVRACATLTPISLKQSDRVALRGRYYAMRD